MDHPTQGRRRRHKSPSNASAAPLLPVPRLADHLDTNDGPSDEEGEKEAKRQKSEPTTPISTSSRPQTSTTRLWESLQWIQGKLKGLRRGLNRNSKTLKKNFGRSSLQECLDRLNQARVDAPATRQKADKEKQHSQEPRGPLKNYVGVVVPSWSLPSP